MDTGQLKKYAVQARRDFRDAVSARAKRIGVSDSNVQQYSVKGDLLIIGEQTFPKDYKAAFDALYREVAAKGFEQVIDETAYTWFNRFVALRFMELHDYFPHGLRVLSSTDEDPTPQILRNPTQLSFTHSFNKKLAQELFEAGNKEEELYRMVLIAQCNELNLIMPFLFERVSDLSELLLPDNLLASDSIIRKLVSEIEEGEWSTGVEIIGWIYQYYISERKDEVIGSVVKSEDIPAATQLFTPNWIVKYLVQNSVGAYWLGTYPDSPLKSKMEYYITPAEQEPEVIAELKKITPTEINPETITVLDPACGSGHILVEAYDVLKEIYLERGYRPREIPRLILEKNLFGLDIDCRAAQLASFALLMKARADDRSIFSADHPVKLNVLEIVETDFNIDQAVQSLTKGKNVSIEQVEMPFMAKPTQGQLPLAAPGTLSPTELREFLELFKDAKTFGSLITVPDSIKGKVAGIRTIAEKFNRSGDIFEQMYGRRVLRLCEQALILGKHFDAVIANPPYMGSKFYNSNLKTFIATYYSESKADLYGCFTSRALKITKPGGYASLITIPNWMFLSTFEDFRRLILHNAVISSLVHNGRGVFGSDFGSCAFVLQAFQSKRFKGIFRRLFAAQGEVNSNSELSTYFHSAKNLLASSEQLDLIPGTPIAYWVTDGLRRIFKDSSALSDIAEPRQGMATADNTRFLRCWWEVSHLKIGFSFGSREEALESNRKWFPYNKGGDFRKWYGNNQFVVNWEKDGYEIRNFADETGYIRSRAQNTEFFFRPGITWTFVSSSKFGVRMSDRGFLFDVGGSSLFPAEQDIEFLLGLLCSTISYEALKATNPTLNFQVGNVGQIPVARGISDKVRSDVVTTVNKAVRLSKEDWDEFETSWGFQETPLVIDNEKCKLLSSAFLAYVNRKNANTEALRSLETNNNLLFIEAYGLEQELSPEVSEQEITLHRPNQLEDLQSYLSYATGCILGRYSLGKPGLAYAHAGNIGFNSDNYVRFPADSDGVVPILDYPWFTDDITTRFREFLIACWGEDTLEENMKFVADSLEPKRGETPEETIRRYFCDDFFKNHLKMYKKRPIYWLFSSGKEKAFQALVYMHRYNEQTLSKMRTDYVLPLQGKMSNEEKRLDSQAESSSSPAERNRYKKELEKLKKKQAELRKFDELLHHYADKRISLDLDDGVKVNYGKFGALLAEVKQITGGNEE